MSASTVASVAREEEPSSIPVEVASLFFTGLNEPKPTSIDFSLNGDYFISSHGDDALRLIDVCAMTHTQTIQCENFGVHAARFTQSSHVACVLPRHPLDGHLHLLNLETAQLVGELAYMNAYERELHPFPNTPVYSTLAQCPRTDLLGAVVSARGSLALFNPLVSGAIASSAEKFLSGSKISLSFGPDGNHIVVGDDHRVTLFDRRMLFSSPVVGVANRDVFDEARDQARCKGAELSVDGENLLLTSSSGEVAVYNLRLEAVVCKYFHGDAKAHFVGSADATGAKYVHTHSSPSLVAQPTSSMVGGRHLLVYDMFDPVYTEDFMDNGSLSTSFTPKLGSLKYELQSKDSDVPVALAVNPRYSLVATAARNVTWWSFN